MSRYPNQPPQGSWLPQAPSVPPEYDDYADERQLSDPSVSQTQLGPQAYTSSHRNLPPSSASFPTLPHPSPEAGPRPSTSAPPYGHVNYQYSTQASYRRTYSQSTNRPSHGHDRLLRDYTHNVNTPPAPPTRPPASSHNVITQLSGWVQALNNYYQDKGISTSYIAYSTPIPLGGDRFTVSVTLHDQASYRPRFDGHAVGKHAAKEVAAHNALRWLRSQNPQPTDHDDEGR